jgi:hypothetical protein
MRQHFLQLAAIPATLSAVPALAHPGHLEEVAGHTHWLALGALSFAALIAAAGLVRTLRRRNGTADRSAGRN